MSFFETLVALLMFAVAMLQVSRRTWIPYSTMLAIAGVGVALIPGGPKIALDGQTALALFIAPVLLDAAFDFPLAAMRSLWRPLVALAVVAVLVTTAVVAWIGWAFAGLPIAAAITLGAIVAPPDAAAATTVLRSATLPRRTVQVLTGESLLNDAAALLLFAGAVAVQSNGGIDGTVALRIGLAAPGGVLMGLAIGWLYGRIMPHVRGSLGGNLLEFVNTFAAWLVAEHLGVSPVLCVVTMAMFIANQPRVRADARNRVQSFAVWTVIVFLLNVVAFLLMGMQARQIVLDMPSDRLRDTAGFAGLVVVAVIVTRLAWVMLYNRLAAWFGIFRAGDTGPDVRQGFLIGWCGMRGLVTVATAFALPADFPQRDLIALSAFAVVLATLVLQGLTLTPLIRLLGLDDGGGAAGEHDRARAKLLDAALAAIECEQGRVADESRRQIAIDRAAADGDRDDFETRQKLKRLAIVAQRDKLQYLRDRDVIGEEAYLALQEEIDWHDLATGASGRRTIEES